MKTSFLLYSIMLLSGSVQAVLNTDEAAKWIAPEWLFYLRSINSIVTVVSTGLKAYTSESFRKWIEAKKAGVTTGDTDLVSK